MRLEGAMAEPGFWNSQQAAKKVIEELNREQASVVSAPSASMARLDDAKTLAELIAAEELASTPNCRSRR